MCFQSNAAKSLLASLLVFSFVVSNGCLASKKGGTPDIAKPDVVVDAVLQDDVQLYIYVTGRTEPYKFVDVTARVPGYLQELYFNSGAIVNKGEKLARIERDQYQIALDSAEAELDVNKAREALAKSNLDRAKQLVESRTISTEEYQSKLAEHQIMLATVERGKTAVNKAKLDLSYTELTAPITGKASKQMVDVGNLVGPGAQMTLLTIAQMDPMYIDFELSDKQLADLKEKMGLQAAYEKALAEVTGKKDAANPKESGTAKPLLPASDDLSGPQSTFDVSLMTGESTLSADFPLHAKLVAVISNEIQFETGQIMIRGELPNPLLRDKANGDYYLYPGQICRVRIPYEKLKDAVLIREEAILTDLDTKYVLVIKEGDYTPKTPFGTPIKDAAGKDLVDHGFVVHRRDIKIGKLLDTQQRIVTEGLHPGEKYIVRGIQKARIGSAVTPQELDTYLHQLKTENADPTAVSDTTEAEKPNTEAPSTDDAAPKADAPEKVTPATVEPPAEPAK